MARAKLMLSAAIASLMVINPGSFGAAQAGNIKIKAQSVKVKPKVRIKVKVAAVKIATRVKIKPKLNDAEKANPDPAISETHKIARVNLNGNGKFSADPARGDGNTTSLPEFTDVIPQFRIDFSASADAAEAARAAAELKDIAALGALRDAATPDFGLGMPDLSRDIPSNTDRLGAMGIERRGGMFPGDDLGSGPGSFGTIDNSHKGNTPGNPWGVNVNDLEDGIFSTRTHTTHTEGNTILTKTVNDDGTVTTGFDDGKMMESKSSNPENNTVTIESWGHGNHRAEYHIYSYDNGVILNAHHDYVDHDGNRTHHSADYFGGRSNWTRNGEPFYQYRITQDPREFRRHNESGGGVNRLSNPDYVDNGNNCRDVGCIVRGEGGMQPLDRSKLTKAQVLPAGPDESNGGASAGGVAMFTANDVLERYDEDNRRRGGGRLEPASLCKHSECP